METKSVYRNPPWNAGPEVLMASDIDRILDWPSKAIGIDKVLEKAKGSGVLVGICDTGRSQHGDVSDRIVKSANFSSSFDDIDYQGHSTHVAGIIASARLGLAPEAGLVFAKVLGDDGSGDNRSVAAGVDFCIKSGCQIISMSLGGSYDEGIHRSINAAVKAGIFVIVAAGNDGLVAGKNTVGYPARLDETIAIASYNKDGALSKFSSRGPEVDFAFPGEEILSDWLDNKFRRLSGTSMATPFASALAACWLSFAAAQKKAGNVVRDIRNNVELRERWSECAIDQGPVGVDPGWGFGIVDANKFLQSQTVPAPLPAPVPVPPGSPAIPPGELRVIDLLASLGLPNVLAMKGPMTLDGQRGYFIFVPKK